LGPVDINDMAREWGLRSRGVKNVLNIAEQFVDVLARNWEAGLLVIVQLSLTSHYGWL